MPKFLISHRGNLNGKNPKLENNPSYITDALNKTYNVEIDIWYERGWWLGHDLPQYKIDFNWINKRDYLLWIHCKNIASLLKFTSENTMVHKKNYFWHQEDSYTLTSKGYVWTHPGNAIGMSSICVLPETRNYTQLQLKKCKGICSDYIEKYDKFKI